MYFFIFVLVNNDKIGLVSYTPLNNRFDYELSLFNIIHFISSIQLSYFFLLSITKIHKMSEIMNIYVRNCIFHVFLNKNHHLYYKPTLICESPNTKAKQLNANEV